LLFIMTEITAGNQGSVARQEADHQHEKLARSPRIELFGTRAMGVHELAADLRAFLDEQGVPGVRVNPTRLIPNIDDAFYGRLDRSKLVVVTEASPEPQPKAGKPGMLRKLLGQLTTQHETSASTVPATLSKPEVAPTIPAGVIVMPEMREEGPYGAFGTVDTPIEYIQTLCDKHGVPMIVVQNPNDTQALTQVVVQQFLPS
jgi:hypothetical protein